MSEEISGSGVSRRQYWQNPSKAVLEMIVRFNTESARKYIDRYRSKHPEATPRDILDSLEGRYWKVSSTSGGTVGALASIPGVTTGPAVVFSAMELVGFTEATIFYIVARAELHGYPVDDHVRRQTLVMTILLGGAGEKILKQGVPRVSQHWSKAVLTRIPVSMLKGVNSVLGRNVITKYGTKQGVIVLGRALPFGIGAVIGGSAGAFSARGVMAAADKAFGDPPDDFPTQPLVVEPDPNPDSWMPDSSTAQVAGFLAGDNPSRYEEYADVEISVDSSDLDGKNE